MPLLDKMLAAFGAKKPSTKTQTPQAALAVMRALVAKTAHLKEGADNG